MSKAITTEGQVIDVFTAAGLPKPDISILSDQFLAEVRGLKHKNAAAELLEKLLKNELKVRSKRSLVQSKLLSEKLKGTLSAYHNRAISTMEVIEELIRLDKELEAATKRGQNLGLTDDEVAFYDALAASESAVRAMGHDKLKVIAATRPECERAKSDERRSSGAFAGSKRMRGHLFAIGIVTIETILMDNEGTRECSWCGRCAQSVVKECCLCWGF